MEERKKVDIKKSIMKLLVSLLIIGFLVLGIYLLLRHFNLLNLSQEQLQNEIQKFGMWGPLVFIMVSFLQVTFIPIPGSITILAGNYLFGPWLSYLYSFIGMFLGSLLAFLLGRKIGRAYVNWVVGDKETVDYYLKKLKGKETVILFFMFLLPLFPDDILCSIAGIMPITWSVFIFMQIITRITSIGATLFLMSGEIIPYDTWWGIMILIIIGILAIIAFIYAYRNSEKLNDKLVSTIEKIFFRKSKDKDTLKKEEKSLYYKKGK